MIKTNSSFHFKLNNSIFKNSIYLNSNQLNSTAYIDISNARIYSSDDNDYSKLPSIYNYGIFYNLVPNSLYFFDIIDFSDIKIHNISMNNTVFKEAVFRINDTSQLKQTAHKASKCSTVKIDSIDLNKGVFMRPDSRHGSALIYMVGQNDNQFTV